MSAEYILAAGNPNVVLCNAVCAASIPFLPASPSTCNAVPLAKELTHLPIVVDPSHGTGRRSLRTAGDGRPCGRRGRPHR